ncbi:MAG TPA: tetratricopeptide repeat protein [Desulfuromonadales bacterium]|nr:tetratricopeptide repeat protein [Desulfuromonadales bacterium]
MGFWHKLFGGGNSLAQMRLALEQKRWADALNIGASLEQVEAAPEERAELAELLVAAGNGLAELNLSEGQACLRAGDAARAREHFTLAAEQVRSPDLRQRVMAIQADMETSRTSAIPLSATATADCHTGCASPCSTEGGGRVEISADMELDTQTRVELIVASYPEGWAERYLQMCDSFREAFLLAHEGQAEEAFSAFKAVAEEERDDLFYFERGALRARVGETPLASADLERALELNPDHFLAFETLVHLELSAGNDDSAEKRLNRMLSRNFAPAFCHGNLAVVFARRGEKKAALDHGLLAIAEGERSMETLLITASLLEQNGQASEAERVLMCLPGGGCSGGPSLPLAEFWLRHGKNLDKALESFKGALRSEPDNPRWLLRVAQVYLARGWEKEGINLLEKALSAATLEPRLHAEGKALLDAARKQRTP